MAWQPKPVNVLNEELRRRLASGPMNGMDALGIPDSVRADFYALPPDRRARVLEQFDEMKRNPRTPWGEPLGGAGPLSKAELEQLNTPAAAAKVIVRPPPPLSPRPVVNGIPLPDAAPVVPAIPAEPIVPATDAAPAVPVADGASAGDFSGGLFKTAASGLNKADSMIKTLGSTNPAGIAKAAAEGAAGAAGGPAGLMGTLGLVLLTSLLSKKKETPTAPDPLPDEPLPEVWTPAPRPGIAWRTA
jgi:hypothetical protein